MGEEAVLSVMLLAGHWSSNLTSNFMLTFTGQLAHNTVLKYKLALLQPFNKTFAIVLNKGYKCISAFSVPYMRDANQNLPPSEILKQELGENIALKGVQLLEGLY